MYNIIDTRSDECKGLAREALDRHYGMAAGAYLLMIVSVFVITITYASYFSMSGSSAGVILFYICMLIVLLLYSLAKAGYSWMLLNLARGRDAQMKDVLYPFTHQANRIIATNVLKALLMLAFLFPSFSMLLCAAAFPEHLWLRLATLFFFLTGLAGSAVVELSYSMTACLCLDFPGYSSTKILRTSRELMEGNRFRLFYLKVSFLGMKLLCLLTLGIGFLWLHPYIEGSKMEFYRSLRGEIP